MFHSFSAPHDTIKKQDLQEKENFAILILYVARAGGGKMKLYFKVPPEADGMLLRGFLRKCSVSTDLSRAVKFRGSGFFADGAPILANRRRRGFYPDAAPRRHSRSPAYPVGNSG